MPAQPVFSKPGAAASYERDKKKGITDNELGPAVFIQMLRDIPEAEWPTHSVYIWRTDPFWDNTNGGRDPKYITVQNSPVTEDQLKVSYGSGTYKLQLNKSNAYVAHTHSTITEPDFPPHLPPGDWLNHPRNSKWLPWKVSIEKWWTEKTKAMNSNGSSQTSDGAVGELTKLLARVMDKPQESGESQKLTNVLVTWALQQTADTRKSERDADSPDKLTALVKTIKELAPQQDDSLLKLLLPLLTKPAEDPMLKFVMEQLLEMQKSNRELTMKLIEVTSKQAAPQPVQDPIEQARKMGELITTVVSFANPAEPKDALTTVLQEGVPKVIDAAERFFSARSMAGFQRQQQQPQAQAQVPPTVQYPVVSAPPQTAPTVLNPPAHGETEMDLMQRTILASVAKRASSALDLGMTGDQFGEQMLMLVGEIQFDAFVNAVPKDQLLPLFKSLPEAWGLLQPFEPILPGFIDKFYEFATAEAEPEPDLEPAPVKQARKKGAKK